MQATPLDAEKRYEIFRAESRQHAEIALPQKFRGVVKLGGIDSKSLTRAKAWAVSDKR